MNSHNILQQSPNLLAQNIHNTLCYQGQEYKFLSTWWVNTLPLRSTVNNDSIWHRLEEVHLCSAILFPILVSDAALLGLGSSSSAPLCGSGTWVAVSEVKEWWVHLTRFHTRQRGGRWSCLPGDCPSGPVCGGQINSESSLLDSTRTWTGSHWVLNITPKSIKYIHCHHQEIKGDDH